MQSNKYVWFGSATDSSIQHDGTVKGLLSNIYYKYLNGEMYKRAGNGIGSRLERSYWVGDRFGKPVRGNGSVTLISGQTRKLVFFGMVTIKQANGHWAVQICSGKI